MILGTDRSPREASRYPIFFLTPKSYRIELTSFFVVNYKLNYVYLVPHVTPKYHLNSPLSNFRAPTTPRTTQNSRVDRARAAIGLLISVLIPFVPEVWC